MKFSRSPACFQGLDTAVILSGVSEPENSVAPCGVPRGLSGPLLPQLGMTAHWQGMTKCPSSPSSQSFPDALMSLTPLGSLPRTLCATLEPTFQKVGHAHCALSCSVCSHHTREPTALCVHSVWARHPSGAPPGLAFPSCPHQNFCLHHVLSWLRDPSLLLLCQSPWHGG